MKGGIRQRSPDTWQINVYLGRDAQGNHQRHWETVKGARAQRRLSELLTELARGDAPPERILLRNWLRRRDGRSEHPRSLQATGIIREEEWFQGYLCQGRRKTVPLGRRKAGPLGRCLTALAGLGRAWRGGAPALTAVRFSHLRGANRRLAGPATPPPPQPPGGCL